jgi:hypothetical protein
MRSKKRERERGRKRAGETGKNNLSFKMKKMLMPKKLDRLF